MKKKERDAVSHGTDMDTTVSATDPQPDEKSEKWNLNRRTFGKGLFGGVLATVVRIGAPVSAVTGTLALEQKASASTASIATPYTPNGQTLQPVASDGVKRVTLTCQQVEQVLLNAEGKEVVALAYGVNGGSPGPTLVFNQGDRVAITVVNELPPATCNPLARRNRPQFAGRRTGSR